MDQLLADWSLFQIVPEIKWLTYTNTFTYTMTIITYFIHVSHLSHIPASQTVTFTGAITRQYTLHFVCMQYKLCIHNFWVCSIFFIVLFLIQCINLYDMIIITINFMQKNVYCIYIKFREKFMVKIAVFVDYFKILKF